MPSPGGLATPLVGAWLALLLFSWLQATASFRTVDTVLSPEGNRELRSRLASVDPSDRRLALRHVAAETNRWMFARLALVQICLALGIAALTWRRGGLPRALGLGCLAFVLVQTGLGASIESLGRALDFVPRPLPPEAALRFGWLHGSYVVLDLLKAFALVALGFLLLPSR